MRKSVLSLHKVAQLKSGGFRICLELCLTCDHARAHTSRCIPLRAQKPPGNSQVTAVCWGLQLVIWTVWVNLISCGSLSQVKTGNWFFRKATEAAAPDVNLEPYSKDAMSISMAHSSLLSHCLGRGFWLPKVVRAWTCYSPASSGRNHSASLNWKRKSTQRENENSTFHCVKGSWGRNGEHRHMKCLNHSLVFPKSWSPHFLVW